MVIGGEGNGNPLQHSCLENPMDAGAWTAAVRGVARSWTRLSDFTFTFHFHALEKEMATHSSVLAWRIPGTVEPGGLPSMGSHRVGHNWSDLAAAAATALGLFRLYILFRLNLAAYKGFEEFVHYFLVVEFINIRFVFPYYAFNRCRICSDILFHSFFFFFGQSY